MMCSVEEFGLYAPSTNTHSASELTPDQSEGDTKKTNVSQTRATIGVAPNGFRASSLEGFHIFNNKTDFKKIRRLDTMNNPMNLECDEYCTNKKLFTG